MSELHGKVAVVLGASAKGGTGWGIAEGLAARGAKVVVAARTLAPLQELATAIGGSAFCCDGGSEADIRALKDHVLNIYGALDIAVNSAATPTLGMIADADEALLRQGVQVNYFGHVYFVRYMAEAMRGPG
ncbi:MAG TPA: SDR family oxidoreductase, partial [Acetobacteraceae bacterium]|nr:SDR family oxidoreductase [Acetobacteraceae bacterium]